MIALDNEICFVQRVCHGQPRFRIHTHIHIHTHTHAHTHTHTHTHAMASRRGFALKRLAALRLNTLPVQTLTTVNLSVTDCFSF